MKKILTATIFLCAVGFAEATSSFITNFPQGFYITPTAGSKLITPLNQYFSIDPVANTNLVWVSTDTQHGGFLMELLPANAPKTVSNFLAYVRDGAYENTIIHRSTSITNDGLAVLQAGGFTSDSSLSSIPTFPPITNEYSLSNAPGTVAMAKVGGNPNSATSQWFVNVSDNSTTLNSNNNGGFTVFGRILGKGMSNVINPISALQTYNLSSYNSAFTETPLQGVTNGQQSLYLSNLVTFTRVAPIPYFAYSSDSDAFPADIVTSLTSTNLVVTFNHYPTNNPINGVYITVAVTDTNGVSPKYTNSSTKDAYDGSNTGFYMIPRVLGSQTINFPKIPQQALSNNVTNIATNYVLNGSNITVGSITTNSYTSFKIASFPTSSANVPVLIQILSGPIRVTGTNQTTAIPIGTEFMLTGTGTVTLKATTFGTGTSALVNYYYSAATPVTNTFVIKALAQNIRPFQTVIPTIYGNPPFQIQIPTSTSGLPVAVSVLSGPATFRAGSNNTGTITINGAGNVTLAADQAGSTQYASAPQVTTSFTVAKANQTITLPTIPAKTLMMKPFAIVMPTSSSKLPVTTTISGPASLKGKVITMTGAGTVNLTANQSGNANYNPAPTATSTFTVTKVNQTITFPPIPSHYTTDRPFAITLPTASSKLPVSITISGPAIRNGKVITLTGTNGTVSLVAIQGGNTIYNPVSLTNSFVVSVKGQTNSEGGTSGTLNLGGGGYTPTNSGSNLITNGSAMPTNSPTRLIGPPGN